MKSPAPILTIPNSKNIDYCLVLSTVVVGNCAKAQTNICIVALRYNHITDIIWQCFQLLDINICICICTNWCASHALAMTPRRHRNVKNAVHILYLLLLLLIFYIDINIGSVELAVLWLVMVSLFWISKVIIKLPMHTVILEFESLHQEQEQRTVSWTNEENLFLSQLTRVWSTAATHKKSNIPCKWSYVSSFLAAAN